MREFRDRGALSLPRIANPGIITGKERKVKMMESEMEDEGRKTIAQLSES